MNIKIWGSRGSHPTPLSSKAIELKIKRVLELAASEDISSPKAVDDFVKKLPFSMKHTYGGNTTCIELTVGGRHIIIDCGSGLVNLGKHLMNGPFGEGKGTADIFITHTHWDHIQGIPFFVPIYIAGNSFNFYSPVPNLHKRLVHQQAATHFPILFDGTASTKQFFKIAMNKVFLLDEVRVIPKKMPHPGKSYAYRIEYGGKTFVYTGDCEFNIGELDKINSYRSIFDKADVLLFDAQYTFADSINKFEWGHS
ncbi:MAG: MBL fold metallo-hydrolase, partial [Spirochaetia bacterium]|nr:MBL fold metallo-hydrolase [Spirochaetia bacterium]